MKLTDEEITAGLSNDAAKREAIEGYNAATKAVEQGDAKALFKLYEKAIKDRGACLTVIEVLCEQNGRGSSHISPSAEIEALKDIATQALELAKLVITKGEK